MKFCIVTMLRLFWDMRPLAKFLCSNRWQLSNSTWLLLCEYVSDVYKAIWHCYISNYCLWLMPSMHTFQRHDVRKQENYKDAGLLPFQRRRLTWVLLLFVLYTKREKTWMISNTSVTVNAFFKPHVTGFSKCYCFIAIAIWTVRSYSFAYTSFELKWYDCTKMCHLKDYSVSQDLGIMAWEEWVCAWNFILGEQIARLRS